MYGLTDEAAAFFCRPNRTEAGPRGFGAIERPFAAARQSTGFPAQAAFDTAQAQVG